MDVASHYDSLGVPSKKARSQGPAAGLKRVHNAFKEDMILDFARGSGFLVDLGCGRGGDMNKWARAGVRNAIGMDVSEAQVEEANRRAIESGLMSYSFESCSSSLAELDDIPDGCADAVTSMFSLNYFFGSEESASRVFERASRLLRPGGRFFGVYVDGDAVCTLARRGPTISNAYELEPSWDDFEAGRSEYGDGYKLLVKDTVMDGSSVGGSAPVEYVTRSSEICRLAAKAGLRVARGGFREPCAKSIRDPGYRVVASLTRSFAFEKLPKSNV